MVAWVEEDSDVPSGMLESICETLRSLLNDPGVGSEAELTTVLMLLEEMPETMREYAMQRIDMASSYIKRSQYGAAEYELRLLLGALSAAQ